MIQRQYRSHLLAAMLPVLVAAIVLLPHFITIDHRIATKLPPLGPNALLE